ncbi:hypothetical protein [Halolamina salifodinae]|uniref:Uncharacterized protein YabN with tetrapyrrole methylase and pyrophosphatase domain n=1 Tax=Halolamina salifodinae TaxID=1202767 RepID=A0A8T4GU01_9EURY|nr:uncharacterized protein YabN with tetrapyrrole methylase and pyrophosphatase domain [Halolamina salifodinae]
MVEALSAAQQQVAQFLDDALFALLALAEESDIDAGAALATSLSKYEDRITDTGDAGSGA